MSSAQFLVRSKPILPLHIHIPKEPKYPVGELEYYGPQGYRPEPYQPSAIHDVPSGASPHRPQSQMHHFQTWPRRVDVRGYGNDGELSASRSASRPLDTYHAALAPSEAVDLRNGSGTIYESLTRQPIRKRTAQACEKCRNRKTKCSGERPACQRCAARGLLCTYTGGRVRGPSKTRLRASVSASEIHFASDNLKMPSLDSLPRTPQRQRHVSAALPPSQTLSPIHGAFPHPRPLPINQPAPLPQHLWRDAISNARDLRRVQSYATFCPTGAEMRPLMPPESMSCDLTPHPGVFDPEFLTQLFGPPNEGGADQFSDSTSGSEPSSATQSHFSFSSASPEGTNLQSSLVDVGRAVTPINFDSYMSSPASASASMSSASSPSSAVWSADLDHFGVLDPTPAETETGGDMPFHHPSLPSISDLLSPDVNPSTAGAADHSQSLHGYLAGLFGGDTSGVAENSGAISGNGDDRKPSPSTSFMSQILNADLLEVADTINWDNFTFPAS